MALNRMWLSVGVLGLVLGVGAVTTASAQERSRSRSRDRAERSGGEARGSEGGQAVERGRSDNNRGRDTRRADNQRPRDDRRGDDRRADNRNWRNDGRNGSWDRDRNSYRGPGVVVVPRQIYPRRYGSGGRFSVFFGTGSGYRYGSPYDGRVYGSIGPVYRGARRYYGDVRLQVRPRDAAVFVDGYYAGIVDDFDGVFQRLTLEVGPHDVEIEVPGGQPQAFRIYVDPSRTVDLRADLYR